MKRKSFIYIGFIGLLGILSGCEKDETKVTMLSEPIPPVLVSIPDNLILNRNNASDSLEFTGKPVNPGFEASATYTLQACISGTMFADPLVLYSGSKADVIKFKVSDLNELLLKKFDGDVQTQVDFRLAALLTVDAGTGAPGTGDNPFFYASETKTATVSPYGLPRLDIMVEGLPVGKIESAAGNGVYTGFVKLDKTKPFTFLDPEANISYGKNAAGNALEVNGLAITSDESGWYKITVDVNAMSFALGAYMIGVVGSATPNGWNAPDIKMDYIAKRGVWVVTTDLAVGEIKFRKNDGWAWNLGGSLNNLTQGGDNIPIAQAGNYTITLTIVNDLTGSCTIVKN